MNNLRSLAHGIALLALFACSGHQQDMSAGASTPNVQQNAFSEVSSPSLADQAGGLLFDVAPQIQEKCTPFLVPKHPFRMVSDRELEQELRGLATCLQTAPLRNRGLELALQSLGTAELGTEAALGRLERALVQLGIAADNLTIVRSEPAYVAEPRIVLRLRERDPSLG